MHPGEVLREEFLRPMNLSPYAGARGRRVSYAYRAPGQWANRRDCRHGTEARSVFWNYPAFWMGMQAQYDLERAQDEMGAELRKITSVRDVKSAA